ncbi:hypothetical protein B296_00000874 [Ensete ventricosum]|uniref:Uncharacterized protein n=1 Tax=Ensete ventricosum TaxID=4639 RepID=A0A426ZGP1_ENSVE|nr:hypothetical protein B296_00000874 [Ensete ventricosum]
MWWLVPARRKPRRGLLYRRCSDREVAVAKEREMPWNHRGWYNSNSSRCPVADFRVADEDEISNHRNLLEVLRAYFVTGSVEGAGRQRRQELRWQEKRQLCRRLLLSRTSEREIRRWEEMAHGCSSDSDNYCTWPDAMGREERVGRDGLSFDNEEGVAGSED